MLRYSALLVFVCVLCMLLSGCVKTKNVDVSIENSTSMDVSNMVFEMRVFSVPSGVDDPNSDIDPCLNDTTARQAALNGTALMGRDLPNFEPGMSSFRFSSDGMVERLGLIAEATDAKVRFYLVGRETSSCEAQLIACRDFDGANNDRVRLILDALASGDSASCALGCEVGSSGTNTGYCNTQSVSDAGPDPDAGPDAGDAGPDPDAGPDAGDAGPEPDAGDAGDAGTACEEESALRSCTGSTGCISGVEECNGALCTPCTFERVDMTKRSLDSVTGNALDVTISSGSSFVDTLQIAYETSARPTLLSIPLTELFEDTSTSPIPTPDVFTESPPASGFVAGVGSLLAIGVRQAGSNADSKVFLWSLHEGGSSGTTNFLAVHSVALDWGILAFRENARSSDPVSSRLGALAIRGSEDQTIQSTGGGIPLFAVWENLPTQIGVRRLNTAQDADLSLATGEGDFDDMRGTKGAWIAAYRAGGSGSASAGRLLMVRPPVSSADGVMTLSSEVTTFDALQPAEGTHLSLDYDGSDYRAAMVQDRATGKTRVHRITCGSATCAESSGSMPRVVSAFHSTVSEVSHPSISTIPGTTGEAAGIWLAQHEEATLCEGGAGEMVTASVLYPDPAMSTRLGRVASTGGLGLGIPVTQTFAIRTIAYESSTYLYLLVVANVQPTGGFQSIVVDGFRRRIAATCM